MFVIEIGMGVSSYETGHLELLVSSNVGQRLFDGKMEKRKYVSVMQLTTCGH